MDSIELYRKQLAKALLNKNVESYDENYDENYDEDYENLRMRGGFGLPMFKQAKNRIVRGLPGNMPANSFVAQYDFKISYTSIGGTPIDDMLPVPLFMPLHEISGYKGIDMPTGVTISNLNLKDKYELTYTKSGRTDTIITIEGLTSSWGVLQRGILSLEEFDINKIRLTVAEANANKFFSTFMKLFGRSSIGKTFLNDNVPFLSQQSPLQYAKNILDLDVRLHIQKDTGIVYGMPAPATVSAGDGITFSVFVSALARI